MIIGIPKEIKDNEYRVGIIPGGVRQLAQAGHQVLVETGAGEGSGFSDAEYEISGAKIVSTSVEAWSAQIVVKVKEPQLSNHKNIKIARYSINFCDLRSGKFDPNLCTSLGKLFRPRS